MNNIFHHNGIANVAAQLNFPSENPLAHVVNGERNKLLLSLANTGSENFTLVNAAASYHDPAQNWALLANTTAAKYNVPLIAGSNFTLPFQVYSEFRPQDVGLTVWANLKDAAGDMHRLIAYNSTVTVVEPAHSIFDIKLLFMYLILSAALAGIAYLAYQSLSAKYWPKPAPKRTPRTVQGSGEKIVVATDGKGQGGYPASAQPYEEEWIPEHLKNKGDARRRAGKKGTAATSDGEGVVSAGEVTSGGEGDKKRAGKSKGRGKK